MTGIEMLVNTVLKSMGFDKDTTIAQADKIYKIVMGKIETFDNRLTAIENQNKLIISLLENKNSCSGITLN